MAKLAVVDPAAGWGGGEGDRGTKKHEFCAGGYLFYDESLQQPRHASPGSATDL